jgi:MoaA/NifB/PqqE/SkfB family radical SAM enzyme
MFCITCSSELSEDGSYCLVADESWRFPRRNTLSLSGEEALIWETLLDFSLAPHDLQLATLRDLSGAARNRLVKIASLLQQGGFVQLETGLGSGPADSTAPRLGKLHLELTQRCNFSCQACYLGPMLRRANDRKGTEGTTGQWLELIREAGSLGCSFATVTGGEPFLRKDLLENVGSLSQQGIISEINTNASCITSKTAAGLKDLLISAVAVSLYGFDTPSAAGYTRNSVAYRASLRGVRNLVESQVPVVVKYFATRSTSSGYQEVCRQLEPLGLKVRLMEHAIHGDLFEGVLPEESLLPAEPPRPHLIQETELPCYPALHGLGIEPDGTVRACPKLTVYFGNAFEEGLTTIWERSLEMDSFRTFWVSYCRETGYVRGADQGSLCPASKILGKQGGIAEFRDQWQSWRQAQGV